MKNQWPKLIVFALVMALVLIASPGLNRQASALSSGVVISQVYGGGGNTSAAIKSDFIELFNRGNSPVSLNGWSVQYAGSTGTSWQKTDLTNVTLQPGQYYLIKQADGAGAVPPITNQDATGTIPMSGTNGKVALVDNNTLIANGTSCPTANVVDFLGYGTATNCFETAPTANLSNTTAALRKDNGCTETDNNSSDFEIVTQPLTPRNTSTAFNVCGGGGDVAPTITATNPIDGATNVAANTNVTITFDETVVISGTVKVEGSLSGIQNVTPTTGDNTTFTLDPADFTAGETVTVTVLATQVTDQDGTPHNMAADYVFDFTINSGVPVCDQAFTPIYQIQGSGAAAAITGNVTTEGIVVGDFQTSAELQGFYIQDATGDGDATTSDGIFVHTGTTDNTVSAGDSVRVTGYAREQFGQTTLNGSNANNSAVTAANIVDCGDGSVTAVDVTMPFASTTFPERYEGMLVRFPQELVIAEYFNYDQFGEIVLALPLTGEDRPYTGTAIDEPGAPAQARAAANAVRRITLDDNQGGSNPVTLRHPNGNPFALTNLFRGGDEVANATGVLGYGFNLYRIHPTAAANYTEVNPRPVAPEPITATLHVAVMNTLNFFLTPDAIQEPSGGPDDPNDNDCGGLANLECRGFDGDQPNEFTRQRDKLLEALAGLDADVIGLNEIENTPGVEPLGDATNGIVAGLNAMLGAGTYAYIDTGVIGTDAIRVGIIYKPASVTPVGAFQTLDSSDDPRFASNNRPTLAQTFEEVGTGARFTVAVNHLKSKGSACSGDPDAGDGQGNCNGTRTLAAQALVDWLATDPTGSGDPDFLIMGDLNSYAMEDPIDAIKLGSDDTASTSDDYVNLIAQYQGAYAYSYTFDGQAGYLDHALAISSLASQVTGAVDWHINSDEPDVVDYDTSFKPASQEVLYEDNPYRSSDHDPVIVGLNLDPPPDTTDPDVTINQASGQSDPTSSSPINFTAVFSEPVTGFTDADVTLGGTAGATTAVVTEIAPNDDTTYNVAVSGMTVDGTVIASISAGAAEDGAGNGNTASTSTDNTVTYNVPVVPASLFISTRTAGTVNSIPYGVDDILKWDGSAWSVWFDGSATGLTPTGKWMHNINAFWIEDEGAGSVILSFTQNARFVPGIGPKVDGMDLVRWDGSAYTLYFDGSDVGLTLKTQEKIDGLHILPDGYQPIPVSCPGGNLLISTQGPGRVPAFGGGQIKFGGEDILGFCATNLGSATAGWWYMVLDGSSVGLPTNAIDSISANADGSVISFTTSRPINVPGANGGHSMVFEYDTVNGTFNGPVFSAPAMGINKQVDGLQVIGDLP